MWPHTVLHGNKIVFIAYITNILKSSEKVFKHYCKCGNVFEKLFANISEWVAIEIQFVLRITF